MLARSRFYGFHAIVVPAPLEPGGVDNVFAIDTAVGNRGLVLRFFPEACALRGVLFRSMLSKRRGSSISWAFSFSKTCRLAHVSVSFGFGTLATSDRCVSLSRRFLMRRGAEPRIRSELILALHSQIIAAVHLGFLSDADQRVAHHWDVLVSGRNLSREVAIPKAHVFFHSPWPHQHRRSGRMVPSVFRFDSVSFLADEGDASMPSVLLLPTWCFCIAWLSLLFFLGPTRQAHSIAEVTDGQRLCTFMDDVYVDTVSLGRCLPSLLDTHPLREHAGVEFRPASAPRCVASSIGQAAFGESVVPVPRAHNHVFHLQFFMCMGSFSFSLAKSPHKIMPRAPYLQHFHVFHRSSPCAALVGGADEQDARV